MPLFNPTPIPPEAAKEQTPEPVKKPTRKPKAAKVPDGPSGS